MKVKRFMRVLKDMVITNAKVKIVEEAHIRILKGEPTLEQDTIATNVKGELLHLNVWPVKNCGDSLSWFNTLKFHPELRRLAGGESLKVIALGNDELGMKEMWDASNPDMPHELRDSKTRTAEYPVDEWFGVIVEQGDKYRLVAVSGFAVRQGKSGKEYAYKGGTKTSIPKKGYGQMARDKALDNKPSIPTITGYTQSGAKWITGNKPEQHEVIPDEVIAHFNEHYGENWDVTKGFNNSNDSWFNTLLKYERNKLRKDIVSHTTFVDGPKPKGAFDLKGLEELAMKIVDMKIRQIKDIPKVYTGFVNDYAREVVYPRARKMMEEDDSLTKKEAIKRAFNRREYLKYAMSKNVDSILNR